MTKPKPKPKLAVKPPVPLCVECRHYREAGGMFNGHALKYHYCYHGQMMDPVTGVDAVGISNTCADLRRTLCGPQGIYWEAANG